MFPALLAHPQVALDNNTCYIACVLCQLAATRLQPTDITRTRTQYTKCRLYRASWERESNARNMQRPLILNKLNKIWITLVSLYWTFISVLRFKKVYTLSAVFIIRKRLCCPLAMLLHIHTDTETKGEKFAMLVYYLEQILLLERWLLWPLSSWVCAHLITSVYQRWVGNERVSG
jgi:hypothetical protein